MDVLIRSGTTHESYLTLLDHMQTELVYRGLPLGEADALPCRMSQWYVDLGTLQVSLGGVVD